jgi:hypothetical protein
MAIIQEIYNGDDYYLSLKNKGKVLIDCNDPDLLMKEDKDEFIQRISTIYTTSLDNSIDNIPRCLCGMLYGNYSNGELCNNCNTISTRTLEDTYPILWARAEDPKYKFLNPVFYRMLVNELVSRSIAFNKYKYRLDPIRWLCDTKYDPSSAKLTTEETNQTSQAKSNKDKNRVLAVIKNLKLLIVALTGCENNDREINKYRNYPYIMSRLRDILVIVRDTPIFKAVLIDRTNKITNLISIYDKYKDKLFSTRVPILIDNKQLVAEQVSPIKNAKHFTEMLSGDLKNIIYKWNKTCKQRLPLARTPQHREQILNSLVCQYLHMFTEYMESYIKNNVASKKGLIRKHIYGCKSHYTFRCVIGSIAGPHKPDEIIVPWVIGVIVFRPHILNILLNRYKMSYKDASKIITDATLTYQPLISEVLDILLKESPTGRIPTLAQRNPSLKRGSILKVWIKDFKRDDVGDYTVNISPKIIKLPNGDFDGFLLSPLTLIMMLTNTLNCWKLLRATITTT